jgi:hypothetical protein
MGTSCGSSDAAARLVNIHKEIIVAQERTATGYTRFTEPFAALDEIARTCSVANWDNDGAVPISQAAILEAKSLLVSLPSTVDIPEIYPEGTGSIVFEWNKSRNYRYVAAISGKGKIEFAGLFGIGNGQYGELRIEGGIPKAMRTHISDLYSTRD